MTIDSYSNEFSGKKFRSQYADKTYAACLEDGPRYRLRLYRNIKRGKMTNNFFYILLLSLFITSCGTKLLTKSGANVGIGNLFIFFPFAIIFSLIVGGLGSLLGKIPLIGGFFELIANIIIILCWVSLIVGIIVVDGSQN